MAQVKRIALLKRIPETNGGEGAGAQGRLDSQVQRAYGTVCLVEELGSYLESELP